MLSRWIKPLKPGPTSGPKDRQVASPAWQHEGMSTEEGSSKRSQSLSRTIHSTSAQEREELKLSLAQANDRIIELSRSQVELSSTIARLTELASTDVLTRLNNRRRFNEALDANFTLAIRQQSPLSLILLDVDFFKKYNDTFGHSAGDDVLCIVAQQLVRSCRNYDVVARYGGEEFAILLPAADPLQAIECAERQKAAIRSYPWSLRGVTASFGIATLWPMSGDASRLVEEADRALYYSKSQGRDRVTHHMNINGEVTLSSTSEAANTVSPLALAETPSLSPANLDPQSAERMLIAASKTIVAQETEPTPITQGMPTTDVSSESLDRFLKELREGRAAPLRRRTALSAILDGACAQVVFACSDPRENFVDIVGSRSATPQWCRGFVNRVLVELPNGGLWKRSEHDSAARISDELDPTAAMLIPIDSSKAAWLVALRFDGESPFVRSDFQLARLIWRFQVEKNRQIHIHDHLKETLFGVVRCLSTAIDAKDTYTCGHSERVARIAVRLGKEMKLSSGEISDLYLAGLLHDVGKIGIRDEVLSKPGPLTPEEFVHIQEHPVIGERIIANVTRLAYLRPGVRGHHERFDGKGYPDGLAGEKIPLMARILAVADSCDAMMSARRYRPELARPLIEKIFNEGAGKQWDPEIVERFLACRHDLYAVYQRGLGQSVYIAVERAATSVDAREDRAAMSLR